MDAFTLMKNDHREITKLFQKVEKAKDLKERETTFLSLKNELSALVYTKESIFYPEVYEKNLTHDSTVISYEWQQVLKRLLEELDNMDMNREEWKAKLMVLMKIVELHSTEEEKELFPMANQVLEDTAKELGEKMEKAKKDFYKNPVPIRERSWL